VKIIQGDIFEGRWDVMGTCTNLYHTWGAGIVVPLKKIYPAAYQADLATLKSDTNKLGNFSFADVGHRRIYNLYGQVGIGNNGMPLDRNCQYDFIFDSLYRSCYHLTDTKKEWQNRKIIYALPALGSGLAGGRLSIIEAIIQEVENCWPNIEFHLYKLQKLT
jgi:hypothetical protein